MDYSDLENQLTQEEQHKGYAELEAQLAPPEPTNPIMESAPRPRNTEEFLASEESRPTGDFAQGLGRGYEGMKATGHQLAGLWDDLVGSDEAAQQQYLKGQEINEASQKKYGPGMGIEDIHGPGDALDWAQGTIGEFAPDAMVMAATSGAGEVAAVGARAASLKLVPELAAKAAAKRAALSGKLLSKVIPESAEALGSGAGVAASSGALESAGNWDTDVSKHGVENSSPGLDMAFGAASGLTELVSPVAHLLRGMPGAGNIFARMAKGTTKEAAQETSQELLAMVNEKIQDPNISLTDKQALLRFGNAAAGGALLGFASGIPGRRGAPESNLPPDAGPGIDPGNNAPTAPSDAPPDANTNIVIGEDGIARDQEGSPLNRKEPSLYNKIMKPIDKIIEPVSERLRKIDPNLQYILRRNIFDNGLRKQANTETIDAFYSKYHRLDPLEKKMWDDATIARDPGKQQILAKALGLSKEYGDLRTMYNELYRDDVDSGTDAHRKPGFIPVYAKSNESLTKLKDTLGLPYISNVARALKKSRQEAGVTDKSRTSISDTQDVNNYMNDPDYENKDARAILQAARQYLVEHPDGEKAAAIKEHLLSEHQSAVKYSNTVTNDIYNNRLKGGTHPAIQTAQEELNELAQKDNPTPADLNQITALQQRIENYHTNLDIPGRSISGYLNSGMLDSGEHSTLAPHQLDEISEIFDAYNNQKGTTGFWNKYKQFELIDTLGSPLNSLTQIKDIGFSAYENGIWNTIKGLARKNDIRKEDLGINAGNIGAEITGESLSQILKGNVYEKAKQELKADPVSTILKWTGFEKTDSIGKNTFIKANVDKLVKQAQNKPNELKKHLRNIMPPAQAKSAFQAFKDYDGKTENLNEDMLFAVYSKLLDFQPISMSEVPQAYLNGGNGRIMYMLKTFTIRQFSALRRESLHKMRTGTKAEKLQGAKNLGRMAILLGATGAGVDELKEFVKTGHSKPLLGTVGNNLLQMIFLNRYIVGNWDAPTEFAKQTILPHKAISGAYRDATTMGDGKGFKTVKSVPLTGELYSQWFGYDAKKRQSNGTQIQVKFRNWVGESDRNKKRYLKSKGRIDKISRKINLLEEKRPGDPRIKTLKNNRDRLLRRIMQ